MMNPFVSESTFRHQFNEGLYKLLGIEQLGAFILVLANATQNQALFEALKPGLEQQYRFFSEQFSKDLENGNQLDIVEEDLLVFLKLCQIGFDKVKLKQQRQESEFQCQFNHIRSFRPRRISKFHNTQSISAPYDDSAFNFNKPFMAKESFWSGELSGAKIDLFYNKYPFADLHCLCVPNKSACLPQLLTKDWHQYISMISQQLKDVLPGIGFGFNSYGAYASVNHLYFQMFVESSSLPICSHNWQHNGGTQCYPVNVKKFNDVKQSWEYLDVLHHQKQPYNLLYHEDCIYIMPRKIQGSVDVPVWNSGFTWYELSGAMLMFNKNDYDNLHAENIIDLLSQLKL